MKLRLLTLLTLVMTVLRLNAAPVEPQVSSGNQVHWYVLKFLNQNNVLEAKGDGAEVKTAGFKGNKNQLWKIEGNATTGYTLTCKNGMKLYTTTTAKEGKFKAGNTPNENTHFVWQATTNASYADGWVLSPKANTLVYMNQWGGAGAGKSLGLWNDKASADQPLAFVKAEDLLGEAENMLPLIPYPANLTRNEGTFNLKQLTAITTPAGDEAVARYAQEFATQLEKTSGIKVPVNPTTAATSLVMTKDATLAHEAYKLTVNEAGINIAAADSTGFFYAIQTLKQLMPHAIYNRSGASTAIDWTVPCVEIADQPQLGHRGYMLDVARHFFSKTEVKRILDIMATYKMNRFHWHLTDDQGWRIDIPEYPKLAQVGAVRKGSFVNAGGSSKFFDDTEYGRGMYYTLDDLREIVAYAKNLNIEIIPEIDLPGHMVAAVAAYPEFSCDPTKKYEVRIDGGISKDVLNIGKDETIDFLKCVLGHMAEVFPYKYIHLGGDECPTDQWSHNADCLKRVKDEGLAGVNELQSWLVEKLGLYLKEKYDKDIICWDELLAHWKSDNTVKPVIMAWNHINKSKDAADKGFKSIVVPYQSLYFDMMQVPLSEVDVNEKYQGGWGDNWVNSVETVYGVNPVASLSGKEDFCLGVQGNMWTETCNDSVEVEYQLLPRMLALSETGWLPAAKKDFASFYMRLQKNRDILDAKGLTYATHYFDEPDLTEQEAAVAEAASLLENAKPGKVGYPSQTEYDKLSSAYAPFIADNGATGDVAALKAAIATYKTAAVTMPVEGKTYKLVSASTYYKAKYVGSTAYVDGSQIRFHYTPQVEPEELWQFTAKDGGYVMTNALTGKQVVMPANANANITLADAGTTLTIAQATETSGKYSYVAGALNIGTNGKYLSADCTGLVKAGTNAALCYQGTWYLEEVTDFTAQLNGLVKKANRIVAESNPGAMGEPTEEAIALLSNDLIAPATAAVAAGSVSEAAYKQYQEVYAQYLAMPRVSPISGIDESYYYYIRNAFFDTYYAEAQADGTIAPRTKGEGDSFLWQFVKNGNKVSIISKLTGKPAYIDTEADGTNLKTGSPYEWGLNEYTCDEGKTGIQIITANGEFSWYTNPNAWKNNVILKPKTYGAAIWTFEVSNVATGVHATTAPAIVPTSYYDLQGRRVSQPSHGVYVTNTGRKVIK
ncbi:beta-N-acetylhexosaminidase [Prevotellamassilia timonensis]|uniref:beta-N-acetylhexosaminidase n=1 Tax=Prevotellamassilia timonensis TaxID=1852370 RepID=UPI0023F3886B|nr:beta-N-acetylhexosaminidase [Prevotellamassilia timonensis]MDD7440465.1 beta-N-acetylhexosaminidase [Prevotellamassilia timonensis]